MSASILESEFASRAVRYSGDLLLLRSEDAIALVGRAAAERIPSLDVDGLFINPSETVSPLERPADFSTVVARGDGSWPAAERCIKDRRESRLSSKWCWANIWIP